MNHISPKQYHQNYGISLKTVYNMLERGDLKPVKQGSKTLIEVSDRQYNEYEKLSHVLELKKTKWNDLILKANRNPQEKPEIVKTICAEVAELEKKGAKIIGFDVKSLYRKIKNAKVSRKARKDKGVIKNSVLSQEGKLEKLINLCAALLTKSARKNLKLVCDKILIYAKENEDYWEYAAVPPDTMYKILSREIARAGYDNLHEYLNHRNLTHQKRAYVPGAFTHNIQYMDYIIGDDHKFDVASVLVFDDVQKKFVNKQVKIWLWIEARTMYPLGWCIKVGDFKADDLMKSLAHVFHQYGLPNKAVMVDNGVGRAEAFIDFVSKCNSDIDDLNGFAAKYSPHDTNSPLEFSQAYTPTNKSTGERIFKMFKEEHDSDFENFVGPDKMNESRHRGLSMSPEQAQQTFEQFKKSFESYLTGFYLARPRKRVIDGRKMKISTGEYWNMCAAHHEKREIEMKTIRFAFQKTEVKKFSSRFIFRGSQYIPEPGTVLPLSFYNRNYNVYFNPDNLNEIDLYAIDDMKDSESELFKSRGEHVCTLCSLTADDPNIRKKVADYNKMMNKKFKDTAKILQAKTELLTGEEEKFSVDKIAADGKYLAERNAAIKDIEEDLKNAVPIAKINKAYIAERKEDAKAINKEDDDERFELTYNGNK